VVLTAKLRFFLLGSITNFTFNHKFVILGSITNFTFNMKLSADGNLGKLSCFFFMKHDSPKYSLYNCYHNNVDDRNILHNATDIEEDLLL
jgi:hypothetical protein